MKIKYVTNKYDHWPHGVLIGVCEQLLQLVHELLEYARHLILSVIVLQPQPRVRFAFILNDECIKCPERIAKNTRYEPYYGVC